MTPNEQCAANAAAPMESARALAKAAVPHGGEPPDVVVANVALLTLNDQLDEGALLAAFMRALASTGHGLNQPRNLVRTHLLRAFDQTWAAFGAEVKGK